MQFDKVIAVQNYGASGTLLIQSLLDNHPDIISLPALHAHQLLSFWKSAPKTNQEAFLNKFVNEHNYWFEPEKNSNLADLGLTQMGANQNEMVYIDKTKFMNLLREYWAASQPLTRKTFICSIYIAYNLCLNKTFTADAWLLFPIHSLPKEYAYNLIEDFSQVNFLHMHRDPIQNMGSTAKHINHYANWQFLYLLECVTSQMLLDVAIHIGGHDAYGLYPYFHDSLDDKIQSRSLRLEDIHRFPKKVLTAICLWLNIPWNDCLLQSTFDNKLWNNRPESVKQTGIGLKVISQKHTEVMSYFDKLRLRTLAMPILLHLGYRNKPSLLSKIIWIFLPLFLVLPFKMELMFSRYMSQAKKLNSLINTGELSKEREKLSKTFSQKYLGSKFINGVVVALYNTKQFVICRKLLLGIWRNKYNQNAIVQPLIK